MRRSRGNGCATVIVLGFLLLSGAGCTSRESRDYPQASQNILRFAQQSNTSRTAVVGLLGAPSSTDVSERGREVLHYPITSEVVRNTTLFGLEVRSSKEYESDELLLEIDNGVVVETKLLQGGRVIPLYPKKNAGGNTP